MGQAAGHKFGQFIGEFCELAIEPLLQNFADQHGLFLDKKGTRPARSGKKIRWIDSFKNAHDLDFVLERGGSPDKIGTPIAFIESAWRRYTKHSKNKAQEIQCAILPIAEKHRFSAPMLGCILVGVYTSGALDQLKSVGFKVLYFSYESVIAAFESVGLDARFDESTLDSDFGKKIKQWKNVAQNKRVVLGKKLLDLNERNVQDFMIHLVRTVKRQITAIRIIPLHGSARDCTSVPEAITFIDTYVETAATGPLVKYEFLIRYDNGDKIEGEFQDKASTIEFLLAYQSGNWTPAIDVHEADVK